MLFLGLFLAVLLIAYLVFFVQFEVAAFKQSVWWGLGTFFLWPVHLAFLIVHWSEARKPFFGMLSCGLIAGIGLGVFFAANREAVAEFEKTSGVHLNAKGQATAARGTKTVPHDVRDLAVNESSNSLPPIRPAADPHAAERAALAKHSAELNALYAELNKERATLKKGSPAVAAFNAKAAKYQEGITALAAEQAQLDALDHPAAVTAALAPSAPRPAPTGDPKEAEANAALARLRVAAASTDYAGFAETLKICLANYRRTAAFPQIAATARGTLANATSDRLAAAIQAQAVAARAEQETAMGKVRIIVNQMPPRVPTPSRGAETYHYGFHPGALVPDYAHADLYSTRELWKGEYVYMDTVPNVFYRSADCEFNPQTKFFFTSRDVPKKKLTEAEIAEVVRLYRIIAADERMLAAQPQRLRDAQAASAELLALNKQLVTR